MQFINKTLEKQTTTQHVYILLQHGRDNELRCEQRQVLQSVGSVRATCFAANRRKQREMSIMADGVKMQDFGYEVQGHKDYRTILEPVHSTAVQWFPTPGLQTGAGPRVTWYRPTTKG